MSINKEVHIEDSFFSFFMTKSDGKLFVINFRNKDFFGDEVYTSFATYFVNKKLKKFNFSVEQNKYAYSDFEIEDNRFPIKVVEGDEKFVDLISQFLNTKFSKSCHGFESPLYDQGIIENVDASGLEEGKFYMLQSEIDPYIADKNKICNVFFSSFTIEATDSSGEEWNNEKLLGKLSELESYKD